MISTCIWSKLRNKEPEEFTLLCPVFYGEMNHPSSLLVNQLESEGEHVTMRFRSHWNTEWSIYAQGPPGCMDFTQHRSPNYHAWSRSSHSLSLEVGEWGREAFLYLPG